MWYLKSAFDAYSKVQSSLQTRISEMQSAALSPLQMVKNFLQTSPPERAGDSTEELAELRRRLAELEAQPKSKPRKPAKSGRKMAAKKRVR